MSLTVPSASGSNLCPIGIVLCPFKLGGHCFELNFIVCINLASLNLGVTAEQPEKQLPYREGQFTSSIADFTVHRKVDLQDAKVSDSI